MPIIIVDDKSIEVSPGTRLVLALEDGGVPILHRCGGHARCTTCRVEFQAGEPQVMTEAERQRLQEDLPTMVGQVRLSCQILCKGPMTLRPVLTLPDSNVEDPGPRPAEGITPPPQWLPLD